MSSAVAPPPTIDLTDIPDSPPPTAIDNDNDVVITSVRWGPRPQIPPLRLPPRQDARRSGAPGPEDAILVSDDDDDDDFVFGRQIAYHPPPQGPPQRHRLFSPPGQFTPPQRPAVRRPAASRIGFGGALMAIRNREPPARFHSQDAARRAGPSQPAPAPPRTPPRRGWGGHAADILHRFVFGGEPQDNVYVQAPAYPGIRADLNLPPPPAGLVWDTGPMHGGVRGNDVHYQILNLRRYGDIAPPAPEIPTFNHIKTHHKAVPRDGFTFDFDPESASASAPIIVDDDDEPHASSSSSSSHIAAPPPTSSPKAKLICAGCDKPFVMGPRTAWGLRCGHVICEKCVDRISRPHEGKGKGKEKELPIKMEIVETTVLPSNNSRRKPSKRQSPVRVRTPRNLRSSTQQATEKSLAGPQLLSSPQTSRRNYSEVQQKAKAKAKAEKQVGNVDREFVYECPVEGCHREHKSVHEWEMKKDGSGEGWYVWKQKPDSGAIAIFT